MSADEATRLRTFAFGDPDTELWGIAFAPGDQTPAAAHIGRAGGGAAAPLQAPRLEGTGAQDDWRLAAAGVELTWSCSGESATLGTYAQDVDAVAQLCRVHGRLLVDGDERELDCLGQRGTRSLPASPGELESLRDLTAWFAADAGLTVVSLRPQRVSGHDRDSIGCVVFEDGRPLSIADPRLSTTYTVSGSPARASLELWLEEAAEESADDALEDAAAQHFPRRAAGESAGACARLTAAGLELHAELFRWHMRGLEGLGVYALARPS